MKLFSKKLLVFIWVVIFVFIQSAPLVFAQPTPTSYQEWGYIDWSNPDSYDIPSSDSTAQGNDGVTQSITESQKLRNMTGECSFTGTFTDSNGLGYCIASVFYWISKIGGFLFWGSSVLLNIVVHLTLNAGTWLGSSTPIGGVIQNTWQTLRDLANMFFIFIIIYIGISTMLDLSLVDTRKQLIKVIIIAIFINFSLVITRVVIDASNVAAYGFYDAFPTAQKDDFGFFSSPTPPEPPTIVRASDVSAWTDVGAIIHDQEWVAARRNEENAKIYEYQKAQYEKAVNNPQQPDKESVQYSLGTKNLASPFMNVTSITQIVGGDAMDKFVAAKSDPEKKEGEGGIMAAIISLLMYTIMEVIGSFVLFAAGIMFITRTALLVILLIFSPVAFICYSTPKLERFWKQWWEKLLNQAFFAPIFLGFYYVAATIFVATNGANFFDIKEKGTGESLMGFIIVIFVQFVLASAFMIIALLSAKSLGAAGSSTIVNCGNKARKSVQKRSVSAVGSATSSTATFAGRNTVGRAASSLGNSDTMNRWAGKSALLGGLQRGLQSTGKASFGGSKGGYDKKLETKVANRENTFKNLEKDKFGNYVGGKVELVDEFGNKTGQTGSKAQQDFLDKMNSRQNRSYVGRLKPSRIFKRRGSGLTKEEGEKITKLNSDRKVLADKSKEPGGLSSEEKMELNLLEDQLDTLNKKQVIYDRRLRKRTRADKETVKALMKSKKKKSVEATLKELLEEEKKKEGGGGPVAGGEPSKGPSKEPSGSSGGEQLTV